MPRNVEPRVLIVRVEEDSPMMEAIKAPGGGAMIDLGENIAAYQDDWTTVSHTFNLAPDGSGWISVLLGGSTSKVVSRSSSRAGTPGRGISRRGHQTLADSAPRYLFPSLPSPSACETTCSTVMDCPTGIAPVSPHGSSTSVLWAARAAPSASEAEAKG